jgi:hypothetical protein
VDAFALDLAYADNDAPGVQDVSADAVNASGGLGRASAEGEAYVEAGASVAGLVVAGGAGGAVDDGALAAVDVDAAAADVVAPVSVLVAVIADALEQEVDALLVVRWMVGQHIAVRCLLLIQLGLEKELDDFLWRRIH